ncbi:hypothetical protein [Xanthomonas dyei]|uniref:hypothetical protein n=1 Tax=Xanthomonas dyei TaxID=743699 RepID=UPI001E357030|nr:hypothetical protein [Xanthomonas dyei]MCC4631784.1 hypothetical protein [Xanthomonas dyei pv. eucalypti]
MAINCCKTCMIADAGGAGESGVSGKAGALRSVGIVPGDYFQCHQLYAWTVIGSSGAWSLSIRCGSKTVSIKSGLAISTNRQRAGSVA